MAGLLTAAEGPEDLLLVLWTLGNLAADVDQPCESSLTWHTWRSRLSWPKLWACLQDASMPHVQVSALHVIAWQGLSEPETRPCRGDLKRVQAHHTRLKVACVPAAQQRQPP